MQDQKVTGFELSPVQEGLFAASKGAAQFQCQIALMIVGAVDLARLTDAIANTVSRHEILRTNFRLLAGRRRLLQIVQSSSKPALDVIDISELDSVAQDARVDEYLREFREESFDLDSGALARFRLLTLADSRHILTFSISSLCADVKSLTILSEEILRDYEGNWTDSGESLQYADFSAWQRDLLKSDNPDSKQGQRHWQNQELTGNAIHRLPYERRQTGEQFNTASAPITLSAGLLSSFAIGETGVSAAAEEFLLTCWVTLLSRLTSLENGLVGRTVTGRNYDELALAAGLFEKLLPIPWHVAADTSFEQLRSVMGESGRLAETWQDFSPYLGADSGNEIAQSVATFAWEERFSRRTVNGADVALYRQFCRTDLSPLKLVCGVDDQGITAEIRFDARRFEFTDIVRMAEQFALLAEHASVDPKACVSDLPLLSQSERNRLLVEWNATKTEYPSDAKIHHLFEEQAKRSPNADAVICGGQTLSYLQLNTRANQIAHFLKLKGIALNQPVVLCVERSAEMIVGLLAVLKFGGCYVPLASDLPESRMDALLYQCQASIVLTQSTLRNKFSNWGGAVVCLDSDIDGWNSLSNTDPERIGSPDDTAYVIFTSGSTGVPKGVENSHRALVNYTSSIASIVGLLSATSARQWHFGTVSTLNADLGNTAIFPSLAYGGCLHIIDYETAMDGEKFANYMVANPLDLLKITPSHLRALLTATVTDILPREYLFLGGEALTWELLNQVSARGRCQVVNHYGPTESTVGSLTYCPMNGTISPTESESVPIGRPIANTQIYILDQVGQPVPVGIPGELFIAGIGLAAGYLNQPGLTAERFVHNPFTSDEGSRMYRTGDRVRYHYDGTVEFLGRMDDQIKIRGFRVEPGEVENVLQRHPDVRAAAVIGSEDNQGGKRLAAYYVPASLDNAGSDRIRTFLIESLPEYMVPSSLTSLSQLPLTQNGKIDRKALADLEGAMLAPAFTAPQTSTEGELADIWSKVLKQERIGIYDNFFELGGHSLLMTQILARIRKVFQVQLALHTLFDNPTVASLALVIDNEKISGSEEDEMRRLLAELEGLSDDEVDRLLGEETVSQS